jgi:peptidoglycan/LPS O-acetylase OafA/YrhL
MDWAFLAIGGFLVGSLLYAGWYTTRYEPEARTAYALIGAGVLLVVAVNTWVDFVRDQSDWFRAATLLGYAIIAAGLVLLVRERRARR